MTTTQENQGHILWTPAKVQLLRSRLTSAKEHSQTEITFEGKVLLVPYGMYLLDFLESEFALRGTSPTH